MKIKTNLPKEYQEYLDSPDGKMTTLHVKSYHKEQTKKSILNILFPKK